MIGTSVSALFLFAIAAANIVVLLQVYRAFRTVKQGGRLVEDDVDGILAKRGFLGRIFRPLRLTSNCLVGVLGRVDVLGLGRRT